MLGLTVIIPCKNEEKYISLCLDSLLRQECPSLDMEIIVVDNGSTDGTIRILDSYGSKIRFHVRPGLTISGLRNFGVENTTKEWIAFVDADVEVGKNWGKALIDFLEEYAIKGADIKRVITGSTCLVPENPTWIEQIWYEQLILRDEESVKYINSGNLILHREMMNRLGGFDTSYKTGEEEKLCENARVHYGGIILKNSNIKAVHHGYPKDILAFFQRMRWHGEGMTKYLAKPWKSKPLILAIYYLFLSLGYLIFVSISNYYLYLTIFYIILQLLPAFLYAIMRYRGKLKQTSLLTLLYLCFGWARAISLIDAISHREVIHDK
jgi:glycosyltransferase involved in cell wall biosynthesis